MTSRIASPLVIGVLATLGVAAWAGCSASSERYYCDGAGCFQCDAYGCSGVKGPSHAACTSSSTCGAGSVCTTTGCATVCAGDYACPRGETCQSGYCSPPGTVPGSKQECTKTADCGGGKTCSKGSCEACGGDAGPCPCSGPTDCGSGLACVAGACTPTQDTCKYTSECGDGKICAEGQCLASCASAPCAAGFTCTVGVCHPTPGGTSDGDGGVIAGGCTAKADCTKPATPDCVNHTCVKACDSDPVCGDGNYCNQGACVVDTRPKPNCTTDEQCGTSATPRKCVSGYCKYTCTVAQGDAYCRTIDTRIGACAKDGVCRSAAEANAACTGPGQCPSGQQCIDNACK